MKNTDENVEKDSCSASNTQSVATATDESIYNYSLMAQIKEMLSRTQFFTKDGKIPTTENFYIKFCYLLIFLFFMSTYGRSEIVWKYLIIYPKPRWPSALHLTENGVAGFISKNGGNVSQCHSDSIKEMQNSSALSSRSSPLQQGISFRYQQMQQQHPDKAMDILIEQ
ncbi:hypothetical protein T11_7844 [Trichinella zimbabwensis]|uniref:Uncharacterized protein n=1 Tax=Trichinella zimbabwensis TaxID=268475 RepID=A0A0V1GZQ6_9BILA|nr:hypothetical protein T11_7844 [Trichinella zimbabwensis]